MKIFKYSYFYLKKFSFQKYVVLWKTLSKPRCGALQVSAAVFLRLIKNNSVSEGSFLNFYELFLEL